MLLATLLLRSLYLILRKRFADFSTPGYRILFCGCIALILCVIFVTKFFPPHKSVPLTKVTRTAKPYVFSSDSLDKYFTNLPKHEALLVAGLKDIDKNHILDYINYYHDKLSISSDQEYMDISNWALGIIHYYISEYQSLQYFKKVENHNLYKYNYYLALIGLSRNDYSGSERYFEMEYKSGQLRDKAFVNLYFNLLLQNKNIKQARNVYVNDSGLLEKTYKNAYFVYDLRYFDYLKVQLSTFVESTRLINLVIALFITFTWFYFLYFSDLFQKEKFRYLVFIFILESALVFVCPFLYKYIEYNFGWSISSAQSFWGKLGYAIGCISLIEEVIKALPFFIMLIFFKEPDDSYDYIFYICISALTFSFIENCIYFNSAQHFGVYNGRALFSTIAHLYSSSMVGYGFMYAKFKKGIRHRWAYIVAFFIGGVLFHGFYDFFLFTNITILFYLGYFMSIVVWVVLLNNSLNNSYHFSHKFENRNRAIQSVIGFNLTIVMLVEYLLNAVNNGFAPANARLLNQILVYGVVISFFVSRLAKYDLVKGYWRKITFSGYHPDKYYFNKFNLLSYISNFFLFNKIHPRNYVGYDVMLTHPKAYYGKASLFRHTEDHLQAHVVDRYIMHKRVSGKSGSILLEDPQWYLVRLSEPLSWAFHKDTLILKFISQFDEISKDIPKMVMVYSPKSEDALHRSEKYLEDFEFIGVAGILVR